MFITNVTVTRPAAKTQWDAPEITDSGWDGTNWTISITGEDGASFKYATKASAEGVYGDYADYSTPFTAVPGTYVKAYAYDATHTYTNSDETEFIVPEQPTVATPTITVGSYDYEHHGYAITPYCEDENATLQYKFGKDTDYTNCTSGTPFYVVGTGVDNTDNKLTLKATRTNYTQSAAYFSGLNVAPSETSPETLIPWAVAPNGNYEQNKMHVYKSVSMAKVNAGDIGQVVGKVWKLRTAQNSNTVTLSVNDGYIVNRVILTAYSNNTAAGNTIALSNVKVDGEVYNAAPGITFPLDNGESTKETATYDSGEGNDMNATSSIVFTFDNSAITTGNQTQIMANEITVYYSLPPYKLTDKFTPTATAGCTTMALDERSANSKTSVTGSKITVAVATPDGREIRVNGSNLKLQSASGGNYNGLTISAATGYAITAIAVTADTYTYTLSPSAASSSGSGPKTYTFDKASSVTLTNQTGSNINISKLEVTFAPVITINTHGWASYSNQDYALDLSALAAQGLTAYQATAVGSETIKLTSVEEAVKAVTGLLIKGAEGTYALTAAQSGTDISGTNKLVATPAEGYAITSTVYVLYNGEFHPSTSGTIPAFKAYLPSDGINASRLALVFDDELTGIKEVQTSGVKADDVYYDLSGRRVAQPQKGLYIVRGKKVIIK